MGTKYKLPRYKILSEESLNKISNASFDILENIGVKVPASLIWPSLKEFGATVDENTSVVKIPAETTWKAIDLSGKKHILFGRDRQKTAEFGYDMFNFNGSAGQYQIIDQKKEIRLNPDINHLRKAIKVGDALEHINVVGSMVVPLDIHPRLRDLYTYFELLNGTTKPFMGWVFNGRSAKKIIELMKIVAGSSETLKKYPPCEILLEPISPLSFMPETIDILIELADANLPVGFGPMVQAGATGPIYLAGTIIQENAEILAGIVLSQALKPGLPVTYGGIPHIMDMKTGMISFGSPEQGLMAASITQIAKSYGFPVYNNTGMTDSKIPDAQAGIEKAASIMMGALAGGDIFGHLGISGADDGASLTQLIIDDEMAGYVKRVMGMFEISDETTSIDEIKKAGIGGNFMMSEQTLRNYRKEVWYPDILDRFAWDTWENKGKKSIVDRAIEKENNILEKHEQTYLGPDIQQECLKIIKSYKKELGLE
jgi:trimethylamine---corrinoid protein Co-methyltransferase